MKRSSCPFLPMRAFFAVVLLMSIQDKAQADGLPGTISWSDGRNETGDITLSPGKQLRLFTATTPFDFPLSEVREIRFKPEKEEMFEGFYFPTAGQATQAKTGEVYPIRYLQTEITLANGKVLGGHLFTTVFYVETDAATEKVVVVAKQTGTVGEKLADLAYPTLIRFDAGAPASGPVSAQIDLTGAAFAAAHPPVVVVRPDLTLAPLDPTAGKPVWSVSAADPAQILFAVDAADGIHVAWPQVVSPAPAEPAIEQAVQTSLKDMRDFYDTRTLLGCFADEDDVYSLVMMDRMAATYSFSAEKKPWSLVILHWKYDADAKKTTLLNRVALAAGRIEGNESLPRVFTQPELLNDISTGK